MTKKIVEKLILTAEIARLLKRTESAVTKSARAGHFGDTVQRGPRGEYLFRWPAAREAWRANTDTTRARPEHLAQHFAPPAPVAPAAPAPVSVDPAVASATDELSTAFLIHQFAQLEALPGFAAHRSALAEIFNCALVGWVLIGLPVSEAPWPPPHDPAYVAEANRD